MTNKTILTGVIAFFSYAILLVAFTAASCKQQKGHKVAAATVNQCDECGSSDCIYFQINNTVQGEGTDSEIITAIYEVCCIRGITDQKTIDTLCNEYYVAR